MEDITTRVQRLKRPPLLVRTARFGLDDYNRVLHLRRLLKSETPPGPAQALVRLLELEAVANENRRAKRAEYSVARHVEMLVAIMAEARILDATRQAAKNAAPV